MTTTKTFARDSKIQYAGENISNYFLGVISANQGHNKDAFRYLKKVQSIKNKHSKFNVEFIRTLVLLEKFKQAFSFSKKIWKEEELFYEADLLLGLNFFIKKDYINAEKYIARLNKVSRYNLFFEKANACLNFSSKTSVLINSTLNFECLFFIDWTFFKYLKASLL